MKILVINGPNLNMVGKRDPTLYGTRSMREIEDLARRKGEELGLEVEFFQANHEGTIVDYLQRAAVSASGIILNPGALTHYGLSLRDSLMELEVPIVEVHLSNIHAREDFRRHSVVSSIAIAQIAGLGWQGYTLALEWLASSLITMD